LFNLLVVSRALGWLAAKNGNDILDGNDIQLIIRLKIDGDSVFRVKKDFIVLPEGDVLVVFYMSTDGHNPARDGRDFRRVR
jgi:hypothetical protein